LKSIVSYPDRGVGGNNSYRGNCSPRLISDLIDQFNCTDISDYMCGSGTTEDVAKQKRIISHCYDLNRGFDLVNMEIPERNKMIFWHPPYGDMISYAGSQYSAEDVEKKYGFNPIASDLSQIKDWDKFIKMLNYCMMKQYASLDKGGRIAVLMGDMKKKGKLYSMLVDIVKPGTLENIVIKAQHNCWSNNISYNGKFIPIIHEYMMICRKDEPMLIPVKMTIQRDMDIRDLCAPTWKDVVYDVLQRLGRPVRLEELYQAIDVHRRTKTNQHWKEKVRQTLYCFPQYFQNEIRGVWKLAG